MPQMNGLELARKIREAAQATYLIFITSYLQYAVEGYEVKAFPISQRISWKRSWEATLLGILGEMQKKVEKYYFVETNSRFERIEYQEIIYVYKNNKNAVFVLIDKGSSGTQVTPGGLHTAGFQRVPLCGARLYC